MTEPTILVTGATGQVGRHVLQSLDRRGARVRAFTRDPQRATFGPQVEVASGDFDDVDSVRRAVDGVTAAFLVTGGPRGPQRDRDFAVAARDAGVHHVVKLSVLSSSADDDRMIVRWHDEGEQALATAGLATTALRPGAFMSNALRWAPMIIERGTVYAPYAGVASAPIDPADIAEVAARALCDDKHAGRSYPLSGPEVLSTRQQVEVIARDLGRDINVVDIPADVAQKQMMAVGVPELMATAILQNMAPGRTPQVLSTVADVTGTPPRTFADWFHDHRSAFLG